MARHRNTKNTKNTKTARSKNTITGKGRRLVSTRRTSRKKG